MFLGTFIKVHGNRSAVQGGAEESWKQAVSLNVLQTHTGFL